MRHGSLIHLIPLLFLIVMGSVFASDKTRIAILPLTAKTGVDASLVEGLSDLLVSELVQTGKFDIVDRANMQAILKEQSLQSSGCTDGGCAVKIGNILNVQKMLVGSVSRIGKTVAVTLNFVDVELSRIDISDRAEALEDDISTPVKALAVRIAESANIIGTVIRINTSPFEVLVNLSEADGARLGDDISIFTNGEAILDQRTGQLMGRDSVELARGKIIRFVGDNLSAMSVLSSNRKPLVGDRVTFVTPPQKSTARIKISPSMPPPKLLLSPEKQVQTTKTTLRVLAATFAVGAIATGVLTASTMDTASSNLTIYQNAYSDVNKKWGAYSDSILGANASMWVTIGLGTSAVVLVVASFVIKKTPLATSSIELSPNQIRFVYSF